MAIFTLERHDQNNDRSDDNCKKKNTVIRELELLGPRHTKLFWKNHKLQVSAGFNKV